MSVKRILPVLATLLILLAGCGSDATTTTTESGAVIADTSSVDQTQDPVEVDIDDTAPADDTEPEGNLNAGDVLAPDGTSRLDAVAMLRAGGFDQDAADCTVDGLFGLTDSYNMSPAGDADLMQELESMALTCQGIEVPEPPSAELPVSLLTIEEWRQGAGDLAPEARNGLYAEVGYPPMTLDETKSYEAVLTTADGDMRFELSADLSPITVNSFVNLVEDGYFEGVTFHRVLEGFMAQGGDPSGSGSGGPGYQFPNESTPGIEFTVRGILAMANAGPNTNGSQFFITFEEAEFLGGESYTIFGRLVEGDEVLAAVDLRDPNAATEPGTIIESIRIEAS